MAWSTNQLPSVEGLFTMAFERDVDSKAADNESDSAPADGGTSQI